MKKHFILFTLFLLSINFLFSQTYTASLSMDTINVSGFQRGDDMVIPVRLTAKSGGLILGFQFFIEFDHSLFIWKGSNKAPLPGVTDFYKNMSYNGSDWLFNDNGNQLVALWNDPKLVGVEMDKGDFFFECVFTYLGGLNPGDISVMSWGETSEQKDGVVVRGATEMYSEKMDLYNLTKMNGIVINIED